MNPTKMLIDLVKQTPTLRGRVDGIRNGVLYVATQNGLMILPAVDGIVVGDVVTINGVNVSKVASGYPDDGVYYR